MLGDPPPPPQDIHFKFLHGANQTNQYLRKILGDRPTTKPFCNACGKVETQARAFFECDEAYAIWREIKPKLSEILDGENVQCFKIALKIFPSRSSTVDIILKLLSRKLSIVLSG